MLHEDRNRTVTGPTFRKWRVRSDQVSGGAVGRSDVQRVTCRRPLDVPMPFRKPTQPTLEPERADVDGAWRRQKVTGFQVAPPSRVMSRLVAAVPTAGLP
jgi:hypothetical protein